MGTILAKKGAQSHMMDLYLNGTVFMHRLAHYTSLENKSRGDRNEGLHSRFPKENPTVKIFVELPDGTKMHMAESSITIPSATRDHAVYCMYMIVPHRDTTEDFKNAADVLMTDPRLHGEDAFGDHMVIMKDSPEFLFRFAEAARKAGYELSSGPVEYVPIGYAGDMGPHRKLDTYAYQKEWRFVTDKPIPDKHLVLTLGSLKDIAWIFRP